MENNKTFSNNSDMRRPMTWPDRENQMHRPYPGMCPPPMMPYPGMNPPYPPAGGRPPMMPPMNPPMNPIINPRMPMNNRMPMGNGMSMNDGISMGGGMPMPYYYDFPLQEMAIWKPGELSEEEWEQEWEKEVERLMEMYPDTAKQIQNKVMEVCESMDYEGSRMYDEYPDTLMLQQQCRKIRKDMNLGEDLEDLIEVLFHNEMFRRRCKRGRCRR